MLTRSKVLETCCEGPIKLLRPLSCTQLPTSNRRYGFGQRTATRRAHRPYTTREEPLLDERTLVPLINDRSSPWKIAQIPEIDKLRIALFPNDRSLVGQLEWRLRWLRQVGRHDLDLIEAVLDSTSFSLDTKMDLVKQVVLHSRPFSSTAWMDKCWVQLFHREGKSLAERRKILKLCNAIVDRRLSEGVEMGRMVNAGLSYAVRARNVDAIRYYLILAKEEVSKSYKRKIGQRLGPKLQILCTWVRQDKFEGWEGIRRKQGLQMLLGGSTDSPGRQAQKWSLLRMWVDSMEYQGREYLADLLGLVCGPEAVLDAWRMYQRTHKYRQDLVAENKNSLADLKSVLDVHIKALLSNGHAKVAWDLVQSLDLDLAPHRIKNKTWSDLLKHPQYMTQWKPRMESIVLRAYEEHLQEIEYTLGVRWSGGDDGTHVHIDVDGFDDPVDDALLKSDEGETETTGPQRG